MDKESFRIRLLRATDGAICITRKYVTETIPDECLYRIRPNASYDGSHRAASDGALNLYDDRETAPTGLVDVETVVAFLWRDGKVPQWINVSVESVEGNQTVIKLECCGRFTDRDELLYRPSLPNRPFASFGPSIPPWIDSASGNGSDDRKFSLYWQKHYRVPLRVRLETRWLYAGALARRVIRGIGRKSRR